jgi:uncharacterized protein (UPF0332 family)
MEDCFRKGLLRRVEPSLTKSKDSVTEAREWLSEAMKNKASEAYKSAISSLYLAIFHSARAVLFRDGVREKSHYCVGVYLEKYVDEGVLEEDWVFNIRQDKERAAYGPVLVPDASFKGGGGFRDRYCKEVCGSDGEAAGGSGVMAASEFGEKEPQMNADLIPRRISA